MEGRNSSLISFCLLAGLFFFSSCSKPVLDGPEYMKWVEKEKDGLSVSKQFGDVDYKILYKPVDYLIALELKNKILKQEDVLKRRKNLEGMQYLTFRIHSGKENEIMRYNIRSESDYYGRLEYLISDMQNDISLVDGKDTLPCILYHFERNYGLAPYVDMVLSFNQKAESLHKDKIFIYDDKMFGTGKVMLKIKASDLENIPQLKVN